jgi:hypothetical protein
MENKVVIEQLTETVKTMSELLDKMSDNHDKLFSNHGSQKAEIAHVKDGIRDAAERITKIITVLHEGNGQPPLVTRVAVLEEQVSEAGQDIGRLYDKVEAINERDNLRTTDVVSSKKVTKELIGATVSSIAAIVAAVAASM